MPCLGIRKEELSPVPVASSSFPAIAASSVETASPVSIRAASASVVRTGPASFVGAASGSVVGISSCIVTSGRCSASAFLAFDGVSSAEVYSAAVVDLGHLDHYLVAGLDDIFDSVNAVVCER